MEINPSEDSTLQKTLKVKLITKKSNKIQKDDCQICSETFTLAVRKKVVCHCEFEACRVCCRHYILDSINEAKCMKCGIFWSVDFMIENFTSKFYHDEYRKHQEGLIFDREKAHFNEDYTRIEIIKKAEIYNEVIEDIQKEENLLRVEHNSIMRELYNKKSENIINRDNCLNGIDVDTEGASEDKNKYYGSCPNTECRGVINSSWKCAICDQKVCKSCKVKLSDDKDAIKLHACDPNTLETIALIKKECRKCPKCKVDIYKISGCNQMWCTKCAVAFCWRTGEIFTKNIHNPHYFDWMGGNQPNINICGDDNVKITSSLTYHRISEHDGYKNFWKEFIHMFTDVRYNQIRTYNERARVHNNQPSRIKYLMNHIDEEQLKRELFLIYKNGNKARDITQILESFVTSVIACIFQFIFIEGSSNIVRLGTSVYSLRPDCNFFRFIECIEEIITYTNTSFSDILKKYKTNTIYIKFYPSHRSEKRKAVYWEYAIDSISSMSGYETKMESGIRLKYLTFNDIFDSLSDPSIIN
jgi:hypothetical protein